MTIRVRRERQNSAVLLRIRIAVDGIEVARLRPGQIVELEGTGKPQVIKAHLDWTASNKLSVVDPGDSMLVSVVVRFPSFPRAVWYGLTRPNDALIISLER